MSEKTAIVLDTNFIISNRKNFSEIYKILSETYDVYISEISIQERISQKYLELKDKHDKINKFKEDYTDFVEISIKKPFEERLEYMIKTIQEDYQQTFGNRIIKFTQKNNTLSIIMDRVFKKIPPFINAENASDKGFKDTMIWLSILEYFLNNGSNNVIFITDDKYFMNNSEALCKEFASYTRKTIEICI
jgi:hypothetical protein